MLRNARYYFFFFKCQDIQTYTYVSGKRHPGGVGLSELDFSLSETQ